MNQQNQFDSSAWKNTPSWGAKHEAYLQSNHWRDLRLRAFAKAKHRCEGCCSKRDLEGHHLIYRDPLEDGTVDDIMALCASCHKAFHEEAKRRNRKITSYSREETSRFCFALVHLTTRSDPTSRQSKSAKKRAAKAAKRAAKAEKRQKIAERKLRRQKERGDIPIIGMSAQEIEAMRSARGGFTKDTLRAMGVPWPPPKGWRRQLIANHKAATGALDYSI